MYNTNNMTENNGNNIDHTTTKKFLYTFTKNILNSDKSKRWVAITIKMVILSMNKIGKD